MRLLPIARPLPAVCALAALALAGACSSGGGGDSSGLFTGSRGTGSVPIPSDTRRAGRENLPPAPSTQTPEELAAARQRALDAAEALWRQAEALEPRDPEEAGDLYTDLADDYPISPRAAEARFRAGRAYYRAGEHRLAGEALRAYLEVAPANPNLAQTEELLYRAGTAYLADDGGLFGLFRSDEPGYEILSYTATAFPNGRFADDALLALGDAHAAEDDKDDWIEAVTAYKRLLLEHPDSELVPAARLGLGRVYLARDQGAGYHGGYVDLDPREKIPDDPQAQANAGPVVSGPEQALEQYEALLAPGAVVSAQQRAAAERGAAEARARLAAKDQRIAAYYGGARSPASQAYLRSAAERTGTAYVAPPGVAVPTPPRAAPPAAAPPVAAPPPVAPPRASPPPAAPPPVVAPPVAPPPPVVPPTPPQPPPPVVPPPTTPPPPPPPPPGGATTPAAPTAAPGVLPPPTVRRLAPGLSGSVR